MTGGASGSGRGTVERLVRGGAKVVVCDLPQSDGQSLQEEYGNSRVIFSPADVSTSTLVVLVHLLYTGCLVYIVSVLMV